MNSNKESQEGNDKESTGSHEKKVENTRHFLVDMDKYINLAGRSRGISKEDQVDRQMMDDMANRARSHDRVRDIPAMMQGDARMSGHINNDNDKGFSSSSDNGSVLLIGPGDAKVELKLSTDGDTPPESMNGPNPQGARQQIISKNSHHFLDTIEEIQQSDET